MSNKLGFKLYRNCILLELLILNSNLCGVEIKEGFVNGDEMFKLVD